MAGLSDYKVTEEDIEIFGMIEAYDCHHVPCINCPYSLAIPETNVGFCVLDYIHNRLISARESEG